MKSDLIWKWYWAVYPHWKINCALWKLPHSVPTLNNKLSTLAAKLCTLQKNIWPACAKRAPCALEETTFSGYSQRKHYHPGPAPAQTPHFSWPTLNWPSCDKIKQSFNITTSQPLNIATSRNLRGSFQSALKLSTLHPLNISRLQPLSDSTIYSLNLSASLEHLHLM